MVRKSQRFASRDAHGEPAYVMHSNRMHVSCHAGRLRQPCCVKPGQQGQLVPLALGNIQSQVTPVTVVNTLMHSVTLQLAQRRGGSCLPPAPVTIP
jgi:hypothetical protein